MSDFIDQEALAFFSRLAGRLEIELTEAPVRITPELANQVAPPTASLKSLSLRMEVFEGRSFRALTEEEWSRVVLRFPRILMYSLTKPESRIAHEAPDGNVFTVRDLARAVEATEREARRDSKWFGGVNVHHVFFEGIRADERGAWRIRWGS